MRWRVLLVLACFVVEVGGCTKHNPDYCVSNADCANGYACDLNSHGCVVSIDAAIDGPPDAPLAGPKAYVIDSVAGIYHATRNATGDLSIGPQIVALASAYIAVTSKDGKQVFVLTNDASPMIYRYAISAVDGTLTESQSRSLGSCTPWRATVHPSGSYVVVGCTGAAYALVPIDPTTGEMGNVVGRAVGTVGYVTAAFTPDGACMFLAEQVSSGIHSYSFNVQTGAATSAGNAQVDGPATALGVSTDGTVLYVADDNNIGSRKLTPYQIATSCTLTQLSAKAVTIGSAMEYVVVHPDGTGVFVIGRSLYAFNVAAGAPATLTAVGGSPFTLPGTAVGMRMGVIDPQVPTKLYLAGSDSGGPYSATLNANAVAGGATLVTGGSNTMWIAVAP